MELSEVKSIWQSYDSKLEKTLKLNLHFLELIQSQKIKSKLAPVFWQRVIEITLWAMMLEVFSICLHVQQESSSIITQTAL